MSGIELMLNVKHKERRDLQVELNNNKEISVLNIREDAIDLVLNLGQRVNAHS